jgi:hypothetical protein
LKNEGKKWSSKKDRFAIIPAVRSTLRDGDRMSISYEPPLEELNK